MKLNYFLFLALTILLMGCTSSYQAPQEIRIPIAVHCPSPHISPKPILPITGLKQTDSPDKVVKSYVASVKLLQGYNAELLQILKGYQ